MKKVSVMLSLCFAIVCSLLYPVVIKAADRYESESNNDVSSADYLPLNMSMQGVISDYNDVDYYYFTLSDNGKIDIEFEHQIQNDSAHWKIELLNADGGDICSFNSELNQMKSSTKNVGIPKGKYFVRVSSYSSSVFKVPYTLKVIYTKSSAWESEPNDDVSTADILKLNTLINGKLMTYEDEDFYRFTLTENGKIDLIFEHNAESSSDSWKINLLNDNRQELASFESRLNQKTSSLKNIGLPKGTYYIKISSYASSIQDKPYQLTVNYTKTNAWESEYNDDISVADPINLNTVINGKLMSDSDVDYYRFTLPADGKINIDFGHSEGIGAEYWTIDLLTDDAVEIAAFDSSMIQKTTKLSDIGLPKGNYYIKVRTFYLLTDTPYTIKVNYTKTTVWEKEFNNSISAANSAKIGTKYYGKIMDSADEDCYKINISSNNDYFLEFWHKAFKNPYSQWTIGIRDKNNLTVSGLTSLANDAYVYDSVHLPKGTYYINIYGTFLESSEKVPYHFKIDKKGMKVGVSTKTLNLGDTFKMNAVSTPASSITYTVGNNKIAKVDSTGKVTALGYGNTYVTAKSKYGSAKTLVKVEKPKATDVKLSTDKRVITIGNTSQIKATVYPGNASQTVTWSTRTPSIASVDKNGKITAKSVGSTWLYARTENGIEAKALIKVIPLPKSVKLDLDKKIVTVGKTTQFKANVFPNIANQAVTWRIGNTKVATVDKNGKVTAKSVGMTWVYAKTVNGKETRSLVKVVPLSTAVKLNTEKRIITVGMSSQIKATVYPSEASQTVTWSTGTPSIASVDKNGKVTARSAGLTWLYAKTVNGKEAKALIKVIPQPTGVTLSTDKKTLKKGTSYTFKATVNPMNANQAVTWKTGTPSIASVDKNGKVTAKSEGLTWLYATTVNGKEIKCLIKVEK